VKISKNYVHQHGRRHHKVCISAVRDSAKSASAMLKTALRRCQPVSPVLSRIYWDSMKSALALCPTVLMPTWYCLWQRWCHVSIVSNSADADLVLLETALIHMRQCWIRFLNFKWFLSRSKRHLLEKTCILDMYSPNTYTNYKNSLPNLTIFWLSAASENADENTFLLREV
jgi:hypothetical protein